MGFVFLPANSAHSVLRRLRRANSLLEEIKLGNIQRECREEVCTYEEAREAFENDEKTKRFWEEYVRESNPPSGFDSMVGGVQSLYLIVPLLLVGLVVIAVAITAWRCHSRKRSQRSPGLGHSHHNHVLSVVSMDQWGREYHHGDQSELSIHSSPAYPGSEITSARGSAGDPPPSYEDAVGHTDVHIETEPPPQYDDIVNTSSGRISSGQRK
uniref:Proline rich Gla (G-carboxyglutamic acid) 1 n=1 Tax=Cyprinodon variegatus TaxID=28743 RepID=A0A3Q2DE41_CYPVA